MIVVARCAIRFPQQAHGGEARFSAGEGITMKNLGSLMAAYLFAWGILFAYHLSVGRRISRLQGEIDRLKETLKRGGPAF
jgi:CcmD family protein